MLAIRRILLAAAASVTFTAVAHAQVNLAWTNCLGQSTAAANIQYACDGSRNGIPFRLVPSFIPYVDLPQFVGAEMLIGLGTDAPCDHCTADPMLDWWRLGVGECRDGNLAFPASLTGIGTGTTGTCRNPWLGTHVGGGYEWRQPGFFNFPVLRLAVAREETTALVAGQQYVGGVVTLDTYGDDASNAETVCSGCCEKRALTLFQVFLYQTPGAPGGDIIALTMSATRNFVHWQQSPAPCATPARRTTWGSIKTTYR